MRKHSNVLQCVNGSTNCGLSIQWNTTKQYNEQTLNTHTAWKNLKCIMLNEKSQTQPEATCCMSYIFLRKGKTTGIENKSVVVKI